MIVQEAQHFVTSELACHCDRRLEGRYDDCPVDGVQEKAALFIDRVREILGRPVILNCAFRCKQHNADQEGSAKNSAHIMGAAFDVRAKNGREKFEVVEAALQANGTRFGVYKKFVHIDVGDQMAGEVNAYGEDIEPSPERVTW